MFVGICTLRYHAERAISIITKLFPDDHLLLASSKRVKGKLTITSGEKRCVTTQIKAAKGTIT